MVRINMFVTFAGVLEEARFYGLSKVVEELEDRLRVILIPFFMSLSRFNASNITPYAVFDWNC